MINKKETDIIKNWKNTADGLPIVTIICLSYNHEKSISAALDSILMQETDFPFEIVIHDDASTDNTANIIREYVQVYPHIVKPILEDENQYSKHNGAIYRIISAHNNGKYVAFCETDDKWISTDKIQVQVDFMNRHPECSMCVHNTIYHYSDNSHPDRMFAPWSVLHCLTERDIFFDWKVHTSSYMVRREFQRIPDFSKKYWFGDYVYLTMAFYYGEVYFLPNILTLYNGKTENGVSTLVHGDSISYYNSRRKERIEYLKEYNIYTKQKYSSIVMERIDEIEFVCLLLEIESDLNPAKDTILQTKEKVRRVTQHKYYRKYLNSIPYTDAVRTILKFECPELWKTVKRVLCNRKKI